MIAVPNANRSKTGKIAMSLLSLGDFVASLAISGKAPKAIKEAVKNAYTPENTFSIQYFLKIVAKVENGDNFYDQRKAGQIGALRSVRSVE